jgi:hypothetical protein
MLFLEFQRYYMPSVDELDSYPVRKYSAEPKKATSASVKAVTQPDFFTNSQNSFIYMWRPPNIVTRFSSP